MSSTDQRRDWNWGQDGRLDAQYVEMRQVHVKSGPSAGKVKTVVDFHYGLSDEVVSVWLGAVLRRQFRDELLARGKEDFEPGERFIITPGERKQGKRGEYLAFEPTVFEFAAPKPSASTMLEDDEDGGDDLVD
jgi:hypothetical protein